MKPLFVDTGAWYALINQEDLHHREAADLFRHGGRRLLTTNYVVLETVNLFNARLGHHPAVIFLEKIHSSRMLTLHQVNQNQHERAEYYFRTRSDKEFSLTDCSSFVVMTELGLTEAFAFDRHFAQAGFTLVP